MAGKSAQTPEVKTEAFTGFSAQTAGQPEAMPGKRVPALATTLIGVVFILAALLGAWMQPLRPLPRVSTAILTPGDFDWWRYPLESNPALRLPVIQGRLFGVHALADGKQIWVAGEGGLILHSPDGGDTWQQQHPKPAALAKPSSAASASLIGSAYAMDPRQQANAPQVQQTGPAAIPDSISNQMYSEPSKKQPDSKIEQLPVAPAAKPRPVILPSRNKAAVAKSAVAKPAMPPEIKPPPDDVDLYTVFFLDAKLGWAAGDQGKVWFTGDGGENWQASFVGERVSIRHIEFADGYVLALSPQPGVFWSRIDSDSWKPYQLLPAEAARNLASLNPDKAKVSIRAENRVYTGPGGRWQVGPRGVIRFSKEADAAPEVWQSRPSGTDSDLYGIAFADAQRGWAVGDAGTILNSDDGGQTWRAQTGGEQARAARRSGLENRIYPAPWTWLTLLLGMGLLASGARHIQLSGGETADQSAGIAGLFVSDQPLKPGDTDHLGHGQIARGLADFIRNRNTEPGLTLAVTGSWGSGKSSIMRLLEDDLKRAGFRPAWFNAWHHQQEGRQLASMFNTIRRQAVPFILTPAAWRVRAALYWNRGWLYRLLALGVVGLILLGVFETHGRNAPFALLRQAVIGALMDVRPVVITSASMKKLTDGGVLKQSTLATLSSRMVWQPQTAEEACREVGGGDCRFDNIDQLYASLNKALADAQPANQAKPTLADTGLTDEEKLALADAAQHLGNSPQTMLGVLLGALVIPLLLGKGLAVYGLNYLDLFKRLLPERGKMEGKEAVGTMENFRFEFCNLTQALDGRLVLFIDDLDRCDCATVREVLELVNYLASVGQCFLVLGIAMEHVACCIEPKSPKLATDGYAMQYLKKLVNIEVPVPKADMNGIRAMLENQAQTIERPADKQSARRWAAWGLSLAILIGLTWGMNRAWTQWHLPPEAKTFRAVAQASALAQVEPVATRTGAAVPPPIQTDTPAKPRAPVGLLPTAGAQPGAWAAWLSLLALVALAAATAWPTRAKWLDWLHRHGLLQAIKIGFGGAARKRDTLIFRAALEIWHEVIVTGDPTPRGIKRFVNRVRFLAMMEQALQEEQIPEGVLVGLAALHHAKVKLPEDVADLLGEAEWDSTQDVALTQTGTASLFDTIQHAIRTTPGWPPTPSQVSRFMAMVESMHVR
ncbi:MAG: P-loop NTPase fold protein [Gallionellaceae bacterium]|nr:P-loop NTPase fold protein [Gallionellaceae bacterium]